MFDINKRFVRILGIFYLTFSIIILLYRGLGLLGYFSFPILFSGLIYIFIPKNKIKKLLISSVIISLSLILINFVVLGLTFLFNIPSGGEVAMGIEILYVFIILPIALLISLILAIISLFINREKK